jgi:phosphoribosyl-ATP pyrophosphohydrolase/phosphoribosyl-AMP cyclohydrolase
MMDNLDRTILKEVKFDEKGLVPAITQDCRTEEVLMLAYMNRESLEKTIETGKAHYYSRSRQKLWLKGETSGHFQHVRSISVDCDGDTLLMKVEQTGAACHTGHHTCFYRKMEVASAGPAEVTAAASTEVNGSKVQVEASINAIETAGPEVLGDVFGVILDRIAHPKEGSYTNYLLSKGTDKILKKVGEEASEVIIAAKNKDVGELTGEVADLLYHIMVLLAQRGMTLEQIYGELKKR